MIITSVPFFLTSFRLNEQSFSSGGLPQWPAKSLIAIGFTLLALQGISQIIKRIAVMRGIIPDPHETQRSALEAEVEQIVEIAEKR
jgi:TRAP-type mannitol/chloroaromatic compound transport system permease small subunit